MDQLLINIARYFSSLRLHEQYLIMDIIFPLNWNIEASYGEVKVKLNKEASDEYRSLSLYCELKDGAINMLLTAVSNAIQHNMEEELKQRLLKAKIHEMETLFKDKNLDELTKLTFNTNGSESTIENN